MHCAGDGHWQASMEPSCQTLAAMYRIGCTEELPELPASLSSQIRDFLEKCFRRDPKKRWTCAELLSHPFLNEDCSFKEPEEAIKGPKSPTCHLDFRNQVWDSYSSQTTPILSLSIPSPTGDCNAEVNRSVEQCPRPSPRDRVMALAAACKFEDVANRPNWNTIPHGHWLLVKSSEGKCPTSSKPLSKSDISNGSSMHELPFTKEMCSATLAAVNWEELQPRCEVDECLEAAVSAAHPEHQSSSRTSAETLHHDLFSMMAASNLIDEAWGMYGNTCQSIACGLLGIHDIWPVVFLEFMTYQQWEKHFISLMMSEPLALRQKQLTAPVVQVCALHNFGL